MALEKDAFSVAVENSVTTDSDHEAGFDVVIRVSEDERFSERVKTKALQELSLAERRKVSFAVPDQVRTILLAEAGKEVVSGKTRVDSESRNQNALVGVDEAADLLGVSPATLYTWLSQRKVPFVKVGRLTRFNRERLLEWLDKAAKEPRPEKRH